MAVVYATVCGRFEEGLFLSLWVRQFRSSVHPL